MLPAIDSKLKRWGDWKRHAIRETANLGLPSISTEGRMQSDGIAETARSQQTYVCTECLQRYKIKKYRCDSPCGGLLVPLQAINCTVKISSRPTTDPSYRNDKTSEVIEKGLRKIPNPIMIRVAWNKYVMEMPNSYCAEDINISPAGFKTIVDNMQYWLHAWLLADRLKT